VPAGNQVAQPAATDTYADTKAAPSDQAAREGLTGPTAATAGPDAVTAPASSDDATSLTGSAAAPEPGAPAPMLYRWVDKEGNVQFGENPPEEYAGSAVKVLDL
jgi:anti-sigma factor RsiW